MIQGEFKPRQIDIALLKVMQATSNMPKSGFNSQSGYSFTKADDVFSKVRSALIENGVIFTPRKMTVTRGGEYEAGSRAAILTIHILWDMEFRSVEDGTSENHEWESDGYDTGDKAFGKAVTAGIKLFLKARFLLAPEPGEDSDETTVEIESRRSDCVQNYDVYAVRPDVARPDTEQKPTEGVAPEPLKGALARAAENMAKEAGGGTEAPIEPTDQTSNEITVWPKEYEADIKKSEKWQPYRVICISKHCDPIDTAKQGFEEGCRKRQEFIEYVSSLPNIGPIEIATLDLLEGLFDAHGLRNARRISKEGQAAMRAGLNILEGDLPLIRELKEGQAWGLIRYIEKSYGVAHPKVTETTQLEAGPSEEVGVDPIPDQTI